MTGRWELLRPTFPTQQAADTWAGHVARTSLRRCKTGERDGRWRVWRDTTPTKEQQ